MQFPNIMHEVYMLMAGQHDYANYKVNCFMSELLETKNHGAGLQLLK